ncbi:hypothetical protein ANTPLA_LOCUS5723 [Anthophora plagiata]
MAVDSVITCGRLPRHKRIRWMLAKPVGHHEFYIFASTRWIVSKTSWFPLLSTARSSPPTTAWLRRKEGEWPRKTGIQPATACLTDRQGTLHQIGPTSVGPFVFQVPVLPRFASVDDASGDGGLDEPLRRGTSSLLPGKFE